MAEVEISYKGSTIATMDASGTKILETSGKYCDDNIVVGYAKPSGLSCVKLAEQEFTRTQTSTTATFIGAINVDTASDLWTSAKMILVTVRDKAGKRAGYFLGGDTFYANPNPKNGSTTTNITTAGRLLYLVSSSNEYKVVSTAYGVYPSDITNDGRVRMYARYHETYSLTIDGTFLVEVWALAYPNGTPFA